MLRLPQFLLLALLLSNTNLPASTELAAEYISKGNTAYRNFDNSTALKHYEKALALDSLNYEAAWKLCRAYIDVGEVMENKDARKELYDKAIIYARKAVVLDSMDALGHLFLSISLGRKALDAGAKERVKLAKEIRKSVEASIAIDSTNHISWHMLGRWHRKVATLSWIERNFANIFLGGAPKDASLETAVTCFQKAIELFPNGTNHHLQLGITYEKMKQKELAIAEYELVLTLPKTESDHEIHLKEAKERLKELK